MRPLPRDDAPRRGPSRFEAPEDQGQWAPADRGGRGQRYDEPGPEQGGYDQGGYDQHGYDQHGYDQHGYDQHGYDQHGYDERGFDRQGGHGGWEDDSYGPPGYADPGPGRAGRAATGAWDQGGYDYDRGFSGWGDRTEPGGVRGLGRRGGRASGPPRYRDGGILPDSLPVVPTLVVVAVAIVLAFLLGRATGGGDETTASPAVKSSRTTTTVSSAPIYHTVRDNETLSGIASQYGVSPDALAAANNVTNTNHVFVGQKLLIPDAAAGSVSTTTTRVPGTTR